jgi:hypothetical protein
MIFHQPTLSLVEEAKDSKANMVGRKFLFLVSERKDNVGNPFISRRIEKEEDLLNS